MWSGICVHVEVRGQRLGSHFPSLSKGPFQLASPQASRESPVSPLHFR